MLQNYNIKRQMSKPYLVGNSWWCKLLWDEVVVSLLGLDLRAAFHQVNCHIRKCSMTFTFLNEVIPFFPNLGLKTFQTHQLHSRTFEHFFFMIYKTLGKMNPEVHLNWTQFIPEYLLLLLCICPVNSFTRSEQNALYGGGVEPAGTNGGMKYSAVGACRFSPPTACQA